MLFSSQHKLLSLGLFGSAVSAVIQGDNCLAACVQLNTIFQDAHQQIVSGIDGTSNLTMNFWSAQQGVVVPNCVVRPNSAADVLMIISEAENFQCPFAVKSGGHAAFTGASNIQDGITIDLGNLVEISVSADKSSVIVGPGNTWGAVYTELAKHEVIVLGGRDSDVGVGGLLLGGGVNFLGTQHGFACDNVKSYEVVISGQILNVSATSYPDLYWALRGGGNNFGVVTNFELDAYPQNGVWGGGLVFNETQFGHLIDAHTNLTANTADPKAAAIIAFVYEGAKNIWIAEAEIVYSDPTPSPAALKNYTSLPAVMNTLKLQNLSNVGIELTSYDVQQQQQTYWTFSYKNNNEMPYALLALAQTNVKNLMANNTIPDFEVQCMLVPLTIPHLQHGLDNGGNALGIPTDSALMIFQMSISWSRAADQPAVFDFARNMINQANTTAHAMGVDSPFVYQNHASAFQNPFFGYGEANLARLRNVSATYDPSQTFQKLQPGYHKL